MDFPGDVKGLNIVCALSLFSKWATCQATRSISLSIGHHVVDKSLQFKSQMFWLIDFADQDHHEVSSLLARNSAVNACQMEMQQCDPPSGQLSSLWRLSLSRVLGDE